MGVPVQVQLFDAFLGTQEGIHSIILPDLFSSGGSNNVFIDKFGRVARISGFTKQNASAYFTDTGGDTGAVRALIPYRKTAGGSITRKLLFTIDDDTNEWEIWSSTDNGGTAAFLYDAGSGSIGMIADASQFGDNLYITNGKIAPRKYDGTTLSATGLTQSPTITATESASSGNLAGNYKYKLVSTIAGVRQNGSVASTSVLLTNKQMSLSWTADANVNVDGYEIYRTSGTGTTYYWLASIDGRATVSYTDNIGDLTLLENRVLEEHGDAPPTCYFCEPHKARMWWLRTDTNPTRGYWSDVGQPESVYAENFLDFSDSETVGDQITGALGNYEGLLVVFTEKAVWTVSGTGAIIGDITDWTKTRTNASIGSVSHRSAARVPGGSKYSDQNGQLQSTTVSSISYVTPLLDIRLFDGDNDLIISHPVKDTLQTINYAQRHKIHAVTDAENGQIIWFIPTGNNTDCNKAVSWNYRYGIWYTWDTQPFASSVALDTSSDAQVILTGGASAGYKSYIYTDLSGDSFDGASITAQWMTKTLYGVNDQKQPALSNVKRWRWLDVLFKISTNVTITIEWLNGNSPDTAAALASSTITPATSSILSASGSTLTSASGSTIMTAAASAQAKKILHDTVGAYVHDEGIRIRVKTIGTAGSWALEAMNLGYQILPGLKHRDQDA